MTAKRQSTNRLAAAKPTVDELLASRDRMNRASAEFLKIDLQTALTFVRIARQTNDEYRKKRNRSAARKAYETVSKLSGKVDLGIEDRWTLRRGLAQLKTDLERLGETF
jgi:hypothetical protein